MCCLCYVPDLRFQLVIRTIQQTSNGITIVYKLKNIYVYGVPPTKSQSEIVIVPLGNVFDGIETATSMRLPSTLMADA